jgi:predicted RND superfamily exporter protein
VVIGGPTFSVLSKGFHRSSGYSSLLSSTNPALRSFGVLADIGEVTCLTAALVFLPALARRR